jgi:hypothetical protein
VSRSKPSRPSRSKPSRSRVSRSRPSRAKGYGAHVPRWVRATFGV